MNRPMRKKPTCIVIPAFNEEHSISKVIKELRKINTTFHIVVVNDGSSDNTKEVAEKEKVVILNLPFNLGIGGAIQTGLRYADEHGFGVAIQVDADGQHNPKYIPKLLEGLEKADMVIGGRYTAPTRYKTPFLRLVGIKIFSKLIELTCRQKIYDSTSGYRAFNKRAISFFSKYYPQEFPEPRSIVAFLKNGYKIKEVPVEMRERLSGKSSITPFYSLYLMLSISIAILFESMRTEEKTYE